MDQPQKIFRVGVVDGRLVQQSSTDGGTTWVVESLLADNATTTPAPAPMTGTGNGEVAHTWISNGVLAAFLAALLAAATSYLHSYQPTPGSTAAAVSADPLFKAQLEALGKELAHIKEAQAQKPLVVAVPPAAPSTTQPAQPPWNAENVQKWIEAEAAKAKEKK